MMNLIVIATLVDIATAYFVMQKLFTVQKEKRLYTEHGFDVF